MKTKKALHIPCILIALFFFINPSIGMLDVLPDFVGAALLVAATLHLAGIDDHAKEAGRRFVILALVDAAKMLTLLIPIGSAEAAWRLTFTFCFGIGEAFLFATAMCKLFDGITYKAMRLDCEEVCTGFTAVKGLTVLVAILKNVLPILPELTSLSTDFGDVASGMAGGAQISEFVHNALTIFNVVVVVAYGIGWWVYMFRYFRMVGSHGDYLDKLENEYETEVASKPQVLTYRALKTSGLLWAPALIFALPFRLDGCDYLPDFAAGIFLLLAVLRLSGLYPRPCKKALFGAGAYTLAAAAEWVYELIFNKGMNIDYSEGYYESVSTILLHHPGKLPAYYGLVAVSILKYCAFALAMLLICSIFVPIIAEHTGAAFELSSEYGERKNAEIKKGLEKKRRILVVLSFVSAAAGIVYRLLRMFVESVAIQYTEIVFSLVLFGFFLWFHAKLREGIDNKYYFAN